MSFRWLTNKCNAIAYFNSIVSVLNDEDLYIFRYVFMFVPFSMRSIYIERQMPVFIVQRMWFLRQFVFAQCKAQMAHRMSYSQSYGTRIPLLREQKSTKLPLMLKISFVEGHDVCRWSDVGGWSPSTSETFICIFAWVVCWYSENCLRSSFSRFWYLHLFFLSLCVCMCWYCYWSNIHQQFGMHAFCPASAHTTHKHTYIRHWE